MIWNICSVNKFLSCSSFILNRKFSKDNRRFDDYGNIINNNENKKETKREIYTNELTNKFFQEIFGYGALDSLIKDDDLEEIMVIGINKPVFVYHRSLGMMETNLSFKDEKEILTLIEYITRN